MRACNDTYATHSFHACCLSFHFYLGFAFFFPINTACCNIHVFIPTFKPSPLRNDPCCSHDGEAGNVYIRSLPLNRYRLCNTSIVLNTLPLIDHANKTCLKNFQASWIYTRRRIRSSLHVYHPSCPSKCNSQLKSYLHTVGPLYHWRVY